MGYLVVAGATLQCSQGVAPCPLVVTRLSVKADMKPAGNVSDSKGITNIATFGMCNAKSNPAVIATTAAALGVHTPAPCVPALSGMWSPGAKKVKLAGQKALDDGSTLKCQWTGSISIKSAGQTKVKVK